MKIIKPRLKQRECDCCGYNDLNEIWSRIFICKTRSNYFLWDIRNVVCRNCGFAFVSPVPNEEFLNEYYSSMYSQYFVRKRIIHSIDNQLNIIKKYTNDIKTKYIIDIGSNESPDFIKSLHELFERVETIELIESVNSTYSSLKDVPLNGADILTAFHVLEHISKPKEFLMLCANILNNQGVLILEVPNLILYTKDPTSLYYHEHLSHFTPTTLTYLANQSGLTLIEVNHEYISRPFGFTAVFKKNPKIERRQFKFQDDVEIHQGMHSMNGGLEKINLFLSQVSKVQNAINNAKKAVIWGANLICLELLNDYELPPSSIIVDSDERKRDYLSYFNLDVYTPKSVIDQISQADKIVITSIFHEKDICG